VAHYNHAMRNPRRAFRIGAVLGAFCLASGCSSAAQLHPTPTSAPSPATVTVSRPTLQATALPRPELNPLTGQPVLDPALLRIPAVLISISHFPATARPQAGLSFAPMVYEFYITEGATRFLAVFYGEFPAVALPVAGGCKSREGAFVPTGNILGNRVWFDSNANGMQDPGEGGISGLCVNLYGERDALLASTTTDSNGYYGFSVVPGDYSVEFLKPANLAFTSQHAGPDTLDSDADPMTGRATAHVASDVLSVDAGLIPAVGAPQPTEPAGSEPAPQVGPIRSGRLIYRYIGHYFQNSCLIYASASPEVMALLPKCLLVFHQVSGGGAMLPFSDLQDVAAANWRKKGSDFDYSGNLFADQPPAGGSPATELHEFIAYQNQSGWVYDPLYQAYLRYVDTSERATAGILHPETDRLTRRQLHFENVIVVFAKHQVISPTNLDIHLDAGKSGKALLFRDGQVFHIGWITASPKQEEANGVHPIQFVLRDGQPVALKPGHTWIVVVTQETTVEEKEPGHWLLTFVQPYGAN
jgi:hypothetical protein